MIFLNHFIIWPFFFFFQSPPARLTRSISRVAKQWPRCQTRGAVVVVLGARSAWGREGPTLSAASCEHALTTLPCLTAGRGPAATAWRPSFFCGWQHRSSLWCPCSRPLGSTRGRSQEVQAQKRKEGLGRAKVFFWSLSAVSSFWKRWGMSYV